MITEDEEKVLKRWFSVGDLLTVLAMVVALSVSHGRLSTQVEALSRAMDDMRKQDITSGARTGIAELAAHDNAQDRQIEQLWQELRSQRAEITASLNRLEAKLDTHDKR